ncbi:unnamed protein product [Prunus brigantina]
MVLIDAQTKVLNDQKLKDLKAKNYTFHAIDRAFLETILEKDIAKEIWDSMKKKYQGTTRVKHAQLQALRKENQMTLIVFRLMSCKVHCWYMSRG